MSPIEKRASVGPPDDYSVPIARLMTVYGRSDLEIYDMGECRLNAILSTYTAIHKELYRLRV